MFRAFFGQLIEIEDFTKEEEYYRKTKEFLSALSIKISMPNDILIMKKIF